MKVYNILTIILLFTVLCTIQTSALDWDNIKEYDRDSGIITIRDSLLGIPTTRVAEMKLDTPQVNFIPANNYTIPVAKFWINLTDPEYKDYLTKLEAYNLKDNFKEINKTFIIKKRSIELKQIPSYKLICQNYSIQSKTQEVCLSVFDRNVWRLTEIWTPIENATLRNGWNYLGLFTEVKVNERVEWIPTLFGVRVTEWASWDSSLNVGLRANYHFDETNGTAGAKDSLGALNFTGTIGRTLNGKINNATYGDGAGSAKLTRTGLIGSTDKITINSWIKYFASSAPSYSGIVFGGVNTNFWFGDGNCLGTGSVGRMYFNNICTEIPAKLTTNQWFMVTMTCESGGDMYIYINGVLNKTSSGGCGTFTNVSGDFNVNRYALGNENGDELSIWNRSLSSGEITQLYTDQLANKTFELTADVTPTLTITQSYPENYKNTTVNTVAFGCNFSATNQNITSVEIEVYDSVNNLDYTNTESSLTTPSYNKSWTSGALTDDTYNWACYGLGSGGVNASTTNRTLRVDTLKPTFVVNSPNANQVTYNKPFNISLNVSVTDAYLSTCFYNTNENLTNKTFTCNSLQNVQLNNSGYYNITVYANDTAGNLNSTLISYFVNFVNYSVSYSTTVVENNIGSYLINITADDISGANATLKYNSINYNLTKLYNTSNTIVFNRTLTAPTVSNDTVFYFNFTYSLGTLTNTTITYNNTVLNVGNVSVNCTTPSLYFGLFDEQDTSAKVGSFEYNIKYGTEANRYLSTTYGALDNSYYLPICVNTSVSANFTLGYGEITYYAPNYVIRRYYLFNGTIINNETQNISLYTLLDSEQTSFKLEVEDTSLNPYKGKYTSLLRWYPDLNDYRIVDMGYTDQAGDTVIHVQSEDIDYRVGAYETNGTLIQLDSPTRFVCLINPCTYTMRIDPTEADYTSLLGITYSLDFNETTGIWSFVYSDSSQKTTLMNLTIYRETDTSTYAVCSDTSTNYAGALTCNTSTYTTGKLKAVVRREASPAVTLLTRIVTLGSTAFKSGWGLFLSLLVAIPLAFTFALISPIFALAGVVIALIPALYFGSINSIIFTSVVVLAIIVAHFLKRIG